MRRQRDFFRIAATWPDLIRSPKPAARHAFSRPGWHFRDFFWKREHGKVVDLPDMSVPPENAIERLESFKVLLADSSKPVTDRAIGAAWVLHLVGDVHQPLHCSARVTTQEPQGDHGGNDFKLDSANQSLHHYWDTMIDKAVPRQSHETTRAYLLRAAGVIETAHPKASLQGELKPGKFEDWARESLEQTQAHLYPVSLKRNQAPSDSYRSKGTVIAMKRAALSGYRLAAMLEEVLGQ